MHAHAQSKRRKGRRGAGGGEGEGARGREAVETKRGAANLDARPRHTRTRTRSMGASTGARADGARQHGQCRPHLSLPSSRRRERPHGRRRSRRQQRIEEGRGRGTPSSSHVHVVQARVRVENARDSLLALAQLEGLGVQVGLPLLGVELCRVAKLLELYEKVAQMLLEGCLVAALREHLLDDRRQLRRRQVGEGRREHLQQELAEVLPVGGARRDGDLRTPQRRGDEVRLDGEEERGEDLRVQLEAGLVERVGEHREDVLQQAEVVGAVEVIGDLRGLHVGQQLEEGVEARLGHVALRVLEGPLDRLDDQREVALVREQRGEAVVVDRAQEVEEVCAVLGEVFEVLRDHVEGALEDGLEDARHLRRHERLQLVDEAREEREHLGVARFGDRAHVVAEDRVEQRRHKLGEHEVVVLRLVDERVEQPQRLLLDRAHRAHRRRRHQVHVGAARRGDRRVDHLGEGLVDVEQVNVDVRELHRVRVAERAHHALVGADDRLQLLHGVRLLERLAVGALGRLEDLEPHLVGPLHQLHEQPVARGLVGLRGDHIRDRLVEDLHLAVLEVRDDRAQVEAELVDERHRLAHLQDHKLAPALLRNLEERVARHVLDPGVELVHELEELVDHRLQELPVRAQEARVLPDDVHDVGRDDGLVVLAALHLAQPEQVLDDGHEEALLVLLGHGARDRADRPAQRVQVVPRPLRAVDLVLQPLEHDVLRVVVVEVRQVDERLAHSLVERDGVGVAHRLAHDLAILVLDDEHLLRLGHPRHEQHAQLREHRRVQLPTRRRRRRERRLRMRRDGHEHERRLRGRLELALGVVEVGREEVPVLEADFEDLLVLDLGDLDEQVHRRLQQRRVGRRGALGDREVLPEKAGEEEAEVLYERLVRVRAHRVRVRHVGVGQHHRRRRASDAYRDGRRDFGEESLEVAVVRRAHVAGERLVDGADVERADLGEAGEDVVAEGGLRQELVDERLDELSFKDVPERDPVEKLEQSLERADEQRGLRRVGHDVLAELEDERKVGVERLLQLLRLRRRHLVAREVEDLLGQELEDDHVVLAQRLVRLRGVHNVGDERRPVVWPVLLHNLHQDHVELRHEELLRTVRLLIRRSSDDQIHNERLDASALLGRQRLPTEFDGILQDLQRIELCVRRARRRVEDAIDTEPVECT
mmetsp:Transcript_27650/g.70460  ORF Transcript_27650/g.70460 Transcript_27650/m.70460 type:complete len:1163 (-) Transcript_27650:210-3698(-)